MLPTHCALKDKTSFSVHSESSGAWSLTKHGCEPWIHVTVASESSGEVISTLSTNHAELVKQTLAGLGKGEVVRAFQVVFACEFIDNKGIGAANVYSFEEAKTKRGEVFYTLGTNFGFFRFGSAALALASEVKYLSEKTLYKVERPRRPDLYFDH
jgi:hypothetical protein